MYLHPTQRQLYSDHSVELLYIFFFFQPNNYLEKRRPVANQSKLSQSFAHWKINSVLNKLKPIESMFTTAQAAAGRKSLHEWTGSQLVLTNVR